MVLNYVSNKQAAEITAEEIADLGSEAIIVQADVKDFEACQTLGEEAIKQYGQVDFLVNNAGINRDITFSRMSQEEWQDVIDTNLGALFNMSKAVVPHMRDAGSGVIVSISSIIGLCRRNCFSCFISMFTCSFLDYRYEYEYKWRPQYAVVFLF